MKADRSNLNYNDSVKFISGRNTIKQQAQKDINKELAEYYKEHDDWLDGWLDDDSNDWDDDDHGACCCAECMDFTDYSKYLIKPKTNEI